MKGLFLSLLIGLFLVVSPSAGSAAPSEKELETYLNDTKWSHSELVEYLDFYDLTLDDFEDMEDLESFLGPLLSEETLRDLLHDFGVSEREVTELLVKNGELENGEGILDVYRFADDLEFDLFYYVQTPITEETLDELLKDYELTYDELTALLKDNGDSIGNYEYIEDLDLAVWDYLYGGDWDMDFEELTTFMDEIGLTEEELERLFQHLESLDFDDAFLDRLDELSWRLIAFEDFDEASELTAEQIAELLAIFTELLDLFQMEVEFYFVKGDEKNPVSLQSLMTMTTTDGYDLLIELYNRQGTFLADILLRADMFGWELINGTGTDLKKTHDVIEENGHKEHKEVSVSKPADKAGESKTLVKTEHGAKLPKTATSTASGLAAGLLVLMSGLLLYRRFSVKHG
ncbi:processed acidic surface protein [Alteribacter natronophilus]|uniref:processed acidic surface protein n=1 Tax=Alteribacter natronophilus TaxID=2583810 RepID=UPI0014873B6E|nr:processed acidic surface protein [Alteribacter natronophilus]